MPSLTCPFFISVREVRLRYQYACLTNHRLENPPKVRPKICLGLVLDRCRRRVHCHELSDALWYCADPQSRSRPQHLGLHRVSGDPASQSDYLQLRVPFQILVLTAMWSRFRYRIWLQLQKSGRAGNGSGIRPGQKSFPVVIALDFNILFCTTSMLEKKR